MSRRFTCGSCGGGCRPLVLGWALGVAEMMAAGLVSSAPRIVAVQAAWLR